MRPPCEIVVRYMLPALRSLIAKELIQKHGFSQVNAAKKLGITQAAISYYLYSKRGKKYLKSIESVDKMKATIEKFADDIAGEGLSNVEIISRFCEICSQLRTRHLVCKMHRDMVELPEACDLCLEI